MAWEDACRRYCFYQQVQDLNVESAWERISAPVLIVFGEYDWIMSRGDHDLIEGIVNRRHPGNARLVIIPKAGHNLDIFESQQAAFNEGGTFDESVANLMIEWLRSNVRK